MDQPPQHSILSILLLNLYRVLQSRSLEITRLKHSSSAPTYIHTHTSLSNNRPQLILWFEYSFFRSYVHYRATQIYRGFHAQLPTFPDRASLLCPYPNPHSNLCFHAPARFLKTLA